MASTYPEALDEIGTMATHEDLGDAIDAIQTTLGVEPADTFESVAARLADIESRLDTIEGA